MDDQMKLREEEYILSRWLRETASNGQAQITEQKLMNCSPVGLPPNPSAAVTAQPVGAATMRTDLMERAT